MVRLHVLKIDLVSRRHPFAERRYYWQCWLVGHQKGKHAIIPISTNNCHHKLARSRRGMRTLSIRTSARAVSTGRRSWCVVPCTRSRVSSAFSNKSCAGSRFPKSCAPPQTSQPTPRPIAKNPAFSVDAVTRIYATFYRHRVSGLVREGAPHLINPNQGSARSIIPSWEGLTESDACYVRC